MNGLHQNRPVLATGTPLSEARAAMIMIHGRGASAEDILGLSGMLVQDGFAFFAPQAAGNTWYPNSFMTPIAGNEPGISSAMRVIEELLARLEAEGIPAERTMLLGFSQGACLAVEFAARHARRYGGVAGLSGGLIGPDGTPRDYPGSLQGTPVFLGCSDVDPHIPKARVEESAVVMAALGAEVDMRLYPGMGHQLNQDEIDRVREIMTGVLAT